MPYSEVPAVAETPSKEEIERFLESITVERLTPGEVDELARLDELKRQYGRMPHEI